MRDIELVQVSRGNPYYRMIRNSHYIENKGTIGRQIHYLILSDFRVIGIITGSSAVWSVKARDEYFGINATNREEIIRKIVNNSVFRLELHEKNLATYIISRWRKRIREDWIDKYGEDIIGFETFVEPDGVRRFGALYKADNWDYCGETKGSAKSHPHGLNDKSERMQTTKKLLFCKRLQ